MSNFSKVLRNTTALTISEIFLSGISALWLIYLARNSSIDIFGRYNFVNSYIGLFSFLPDLGVGLIVIREIASKKKDAGLLLGNSFILNFLLSLFAFVVILLVTVPLKMSYQVSVLVVIAALTLFISTIRSVAMFYFEGVEKMVYPAILNALNSLLLIVFGFVGFSVSGILGIFVGMLLATIVSLLVSWGILISKFIIPKFKFDSKLARHLFLEGLPLGIAAFASLIYSKIDSIIVNQMLGERAVGIYSAATPFVFASIQLLNVPFMVAVFPALSRLSSGGKKEFIGSIKNSLSIILLWSIPFSIGVSIFAGLVPLVFGSKYSGAVPILRVLIFYVPFACLSALLYKILIILRKQRVYMLISIVGALISVGLSFVFISRFSVMGAAIASVSTQIILLFIYAVVVFNLLRKHKYV